MAHYPEAVQRRLGILTRAGWTTGTFRVPKLHTLSDYLETGGEFLRLSDVTLPNQEATVPFFALHRSAPMFVAPLDGLQGYDIAPFSGKTTQREVSCLFDHGILNGRLEILNGVRVSDYLAQRIRLIPVRRCALRASTNLPPEALQTFDIALVNPAQVIGLAESSPTVSDRIPIAAQPERPVTAGGVTRVPVRPFPTQPRK